MKINPLVIAVPIVIISLVGAGYFLIAEGIISISLEDQPELVPVVAQIPIVIEENKTESAPEPEVIEEPLGFKSSDQDLITAFLDSIGARVTETFTVDAKVILSDANQVETIESTTLRVQPLDPKTVITIPEEGIPQLRFFVNTDFSKQINDAGTNYHRFTGWDIVNEPSQCTSTGDPYQPSINCPIPVTVTTTSGCSAFQDQKTCVLVTGYRNCKDNCGFTASTLHGLSKNIDISDWTKEGELILKLDYSCNPSLQLSSQYWAVAKGEFVEHYPLPCVTNGVFKKDVSKVVGDSNLLTIQFGGQATYVKRYTINILFNDPQLVGNSVIKRQAIEAIQQLSIIKNEVDGRILDLGFIGTSLVGKTIFDNERVVLQGTLETRIDDKTISKHQVTGNGITVSKQLPLRIDGQDKFVFSLDKQNFITDSFHTFKLMLNDFIVNVGEGDQQRTFEYHTPFLVYVLEFNVRSGEILAYSAQNKAISVLKSDSTFVTCGLSSGEDPIKEPKVLPPVVSIIQNGFTIATTNPEAGQNIPNLGKNAEFCSTIPDLPRDTKLTFKVGNNFFEKQSLASQTNFFLKCTRTGCSSNIGYVSTGG